LLNFLYERGFITITEGEAWPIYERTITPDDDGPTEYSISGGR
jgi:hypothetical protein